MSNAMLDRVFGLGHGLRSTERLVLLALADRCNGAGICWPALGEIAQRTGLHLRRVRRILRRLERQQILVTEPRSGRTSRYHLRVDQRAGAANTPDTDVRGVGQPSEPNTPDVWALHPGRLGPPNPQEPRDNTVGEGIRVETYASGRSGRRAAARKIEPRRRTLEAP
jgi:hypothetical protein